jgi:hypothetical protein
MAKQDNNNKKEKNYNLYSKISQQFSLPRCAWPAPPQFLKSLFQFQTRWTTIRNR